MQLTPGQFARLSKWFDEAAGLPPSGREVLIERVRRDEGDEMALQLANLLNAHDRPTDTMDQPWVPLPPPAADEESAFR